MCGITGFTGKSRALPFLLQGLEKLEYRGYDSAGVTLVDAEELKTWKEKGRLSVLEEKLDIEHCPQRCGIGHTRWATHGIPSNLNAHPHNNMNNTISIVHNGIIENYLELRADLEAKGFVFASETDTETVVHLLDFNYRETGSMRDAVYATIAGLEGSFALCIVSCYDPETIYVAKKENPMIVGKTGDAAFCASDPTGLLSLTKDVLPLDDGQIAILKPGSIELTDFAGKALEQNWIHIPYDMEAAQKGGYDSFMMKEIHEQPDAVRETLRGRFDKNDRIRMDEIDALEISWERLRRVYFIACGTAYHACIYARTLFDRYADIDSFVMPASEFRYGTPKLDADTLCVFVSQSGETADTLAAVKLANEKGAATAAITNVLGSSISRTADVTLYTAAGPEIAVASTKAYTTQIVLLICLIMKLAEKTGFAIPDYAHLVADMKRLPQILTEILKLEDTVGELAEMLKEQRDAYFIGRQLDYPTALEGALKLKEVSYVHADAYYAGELKHGPIALIEKDTVVVAMATQPEVAAKTMSNIQETIARGARIILITDSTIPADRFEYVLRVPAVREELAGIAAVVLLQLFAYFTAKEKGCDIDKPRNLAKSVTVE